MNRIGFINRTVALLAVGVLISGAAGGEPVSMESLLNEMMDRDAVARFPQRDFRLKQQSSYNRASKIPEAARQDPKGWFMNHDYNSSDKDKNFIRIEENHGNKEWVLMDHQGAGAIVRSWMPWRGQKDPTTTSIIRFYLDGDSQPAIEGNMFELFQGKGLIPFPLAHESLRSAVSFFPITYAKGCKVTVSQRPFFYQFTYREYLPGTSVKTFTMKEYETAKATIKRTCKTLLDPQDCQTGKALELAGTLAPQSETSVDLPAGAAAIRALSIKLGSYEKPEVTRTVVLKMTFDGTETVWCPLGDFFGSGIGLNPFQGWYRTVAEDGTLSCRWVMPYQKSGKISIANLGDKPVDVQLNASVGDWTWDGRSLYFNAAWRGQYPVPTRPFSDWNYVTLQGRGVYVGDTLTIMNPVEKWWGEGDEKIFVDGEDFPSIFGTGTEDYYAYSWGGRSTDFYEHPFHAQPFCGIYNKLNRKTNSNERNTQGYSTETRTRALDTMPFGRSLQLDMEVWSGTDCDMGYGVGAYWYGDAHTTSNRKPDPEGVLQLPPLPAGRTHSADSTAASASSHEKNMGPSEPPNVVIIFADDLGYGDLGCFGASKIRTPHIDRMAKEGLRFTNFYAQTVCGPSRAALMTGCYPLRVAVEKNRVEVHPHLHTNEITMAEVLKEVGYTSAAFGKWDLAGHSQTTYSPGLLPTHQGFDYFFGSPTSTDSTVNLLRNEAIVERKADMSQLTRRYTDEAIQFIKRSKAKPFFVYLAHTMPHVRLAVSDAFKGKSAGGIYGDVVEEIDWHVGRLLQALKEEGLDEKTYVIFTSDNGPWYFGRSAGHRRWMGDDWASHGGSAAPLRGAKTSTWEGGLRVPCIVRAPGKIPAGSQSDVLTSTMDLLPTFANLAGGQVPDDRVIDGRDITALLQGADGSKVENRPYYFYARTRLNAVRLGKWKLHLPRPADKSWGKFSKSEDAVAVDTPMLYDLEADVGESNDVAAQHPEVVAELMKYIEKARSDIGDFDRIGKNARFFDPEPRRPDIVTQKQTQHITVGDSLSRVNPYLTQGAGFHIHVLKSNTADLINPKITTGSATVQVAATVMPGHYLYYDGSSSAAIIYDKSWNPVGTPPVTKNGYTMPKGTANVSVTVDASDPKPSLDVQFITKGQKE